MSFNEYPVVAVKAALTSAWEATVSQYRARAINSERTLQAVLFGEIRHALPRLQVFCEPSIVLGDQTVVPDIVVTGNRTVVAAIELKFVPHHYPVFEADLGKLQQYGAFLNPFPLTIDPATGRFDDPKYTFHPNCLLVFAAIGQHDAKAAALSMQNSGAGVSERFVPLFCGVGGG
jgi:hypothetical protein